MRLYETVSLGLYYNIFLRVAFSNINIYAFSLCSGVFEKRVLRSFCSTKNRTQSSIFRVLEIGYLQ